MPHIAAATPPHQDPLSIDQEKPTRCVQISGAASDIWALKADILLQCGITKRDRALFWGMSVLPPRRHQRIRPRWRPRSFNTCSRRPCELLAGAVSSDVLCCSGDSAHLGLVCTCKQCLLPQYGFRNHIKYRGIRSTAPEDMNYVFFFPQFT
jgi:hypothetical protein